MSVITIDTHLVIQNLVKGGFSQQQAESLVYAAKKLDLSNVASKADIKNLENKLEFKLNDLESRLTIKMGTMLALGVAIIATLDKLV